MPTSQCFDYFGHTDFDTARVGLEERQACPIRGCSTALEPISYRRTTMPFCSTHGLRLHTDTFVYWNGAEHTEEARLRNFVIRQDLAYAIAITSVAKAEKYRLGYEMSEDALTWDVFVGLAERRKLRQVAEFLTGVAVAEEPRLYLWGELVDVAASRRERFAPLDAVRLRLERDIGRFKTEPDVMLVVGDRQIVCIEAKFGSGNPIAHPGEVKAGEKPVDADGLATRYLAPASTNAQRAVDRDRLGSSFHSQLFRNVVFASEMAEGAWWHVVNLVSATQWRGRASPIKYSFANPEVAVRAWLRPEHQACFSFRTWEGLFAATIDGDTGVATLGAYFRDKSAHYRAAFDK